MVERQTPNLMVGGSSPSWPASTHKQRGYRYSTGNGIMKDIGKFLGEVKLEMSRVVWPNYDEFVGSTIIVVFLVTVMSLYLGVVDLGIDRLMKYIMKYFGA